MNEIYNPSGKVKNLTRNCRTEHSVTATPTGMRTAFSGFTALLAVMIFCCFGLSATYAQTVLINPAGDGGFNNGTTFAANGWTAVNSANNPWIVGTAVNSGAITGNSAYVSSNGTSNTYINGNAAVNYFYRDITVPAGQSKIALSFNWNNNGETNPWDVIQVFVAPTSLTPVATTTSAGNAATSPIPDGIAGATPVFLSGTLQTAVQSATVYLPAGLAGTTFRLIFSWRNDGSGGADNPGVVDNISLTSSVPGNFISVATGDYNAPATWDANAVPSGADNVTIAAGHTVTVNAADLAANNLTVNGTLDYGTTPTSFTVAGNLTVNSGAAVNVLNGTTGKALTVGGNITNNGSIDVSVGTTTAGTLTLNGFSVQTVSGSGTFVGGKIRNLIFSNTSTAVPNINWQVNNLSVEYNLTISNAKINLGANTLTFGTSATTAGNTFAFTNGGFMPGGKFARWWTSSATGYTTNSTTLPTNTTGVYPFYTTSGAQRLFFLGRTTPTAGGIYSATFVATPGTTTGLSIVDGTYTVTNRANSHFVVSTEGTSPAAATYWTSIYMPNELSTIFTNTRVVLENAAISGTHVSSSVIPSAQRSGVSFADLTAATGLYIGLNSADIPTAAVASGDWNNPATWNTGVVPVCGDNVLVGGGFTVTVNSASNVAKGVTISTGSTLVLASGDLTVGCTLNNNQFTNNGTLTVSGGTLTINGQMLHNAASTFNQSGGNINVDGNNAGDAATSVASATSIVQLNSQFVNWTGGTLTVVDPHANSTASNSFAYTNSTANVNVTAGHTIRFGDGVSTDAGGNATNGFRVNTWAGSNRIAFFNFVANGGTGTNRHVSPTYTHGVFGNLTVNVNSEYRDNGTTVHVAGNVTVTGRYLSTGTLYFGTYLNGTAGVSTTAQQVTVTGEVVNLATNATANFTGLSVNNTSTDGVTFTGTSPITGQPAGSVSVSGTLTFVAGKLRSTDATSFMLGVSGTTLGTLSYTAGGFTSGTTFARWFGATSIGSAITAGTDATAALGRFPFVSAAGANRSAYLERVTPTAAAGAIGVTYNGVAGTTPVNVTDGGYTVNQKANDTWAVSEMGGTPLSAASFELNLVAPSIFVSTPAAPNVRLIQGTAFVGTHQAGTLTPGAQRAGLTPAELTAAPFTLAINSADFPVTSIASGNWNTASTWSTGVVPVCGDAVVIANGHTVTVNSNVNEASAININTGGTLVIASGDLTIGCTNNNNQFTNNGTLTVNGGTLNINGQMLHSAGSTFNQTAGDINVDGNNAGDAATSVASGTSIVQLNSQNISWTGGMLTIVDPHANSTASNSFTYTNSTAHVDVTAGHTIRFGDGNSSDAGGNATNGFRISTWPGSNRISFFNFVVNGGTGTNRHVTTAYAFGISGDMSVNISSEFRDSNSVVHIAGNLDVTGTYFATGTLYFGKLLGSTTSASANAQQVTASGEFINSLTAQTASISSLTLNNSSAAGVTINMPLTMSGTLNLIAGKLNTTSMNTLRLGTDTAAGTLTAAVGGYINGPFSRTIAASNANTAFIHFPVGKAAYAPVWIAPKTVDVTVISAETFDTNAGTAAASINSLAANRRWEATVQSGNVENLNVRLGDANLANTNILAMAPSADGEYSGTFGSTATFTAGTGGALNTIQATAPIAIDQYTGYLSYAKSNACLGAPAPGNTLVSDNTICAGKSVTFSVENLTDGTGVTYQWQSSVDGTDWTNITGATNATYVTAPAGELYYRLNVTCASGPDTTSSTPVQVTFENEITDTTDGERCGAGTVTLEATGTGTDIFWYATATSAVPLHTGPTFETPSISANTTYYVSTGTSSGFDIAGLTSPTALGGTTGVQTVAWNVDFTVLVPTTLSSVDVYPIASGQAASIQVRTSTGTVIATYPYTTAVSGGTTAQTVTIGHDFVPGNYQLYTVLPSSGITRTTSGTVYPITTPTVSITGNGWDMTFFMGMYNWTFGSQCMSPRVPVTATVTTAPALTLSAGTATICEGQTSSAVTVTSDATDYDTYVWTPSTGVSGNATTGWTFNPTETTTYTLNASQSTGAECTAPVSTVVVTVNPVPTAIVISPVTTPACIDRPVALTANGGLVGIERTLGTATTLTGDQEQPTAFNNRWTNSTTQMIFTPAELTALGLMAGEINSIAFEVATLGSAATNTNFTVKMGPADAATFANTTFASTTNFTTVFGPVTYTHTATGWQTIQFDTPYVWDGTSNILVSITMGGANSANNTQTYYTATTGNTVLWANSVTAATGTLSTKRLNTRFNATGNGAVTWSPVTNLYTDAAATVAYTAGANSRTVYLKAPVGGTTQYTATVTTPASCSATAQVSVTLIDGIAGPTGDETQVISVDNPADATIEDIVVNETGVIWFASEAEALAGTPALAAGTQLVDNTTYWGILTNGTCLSEPLSVLVTVTLGKDDFDMNSFSCYPNPVNDILNIKYSADIESVNVYNMLGQQVIGKKVNATETTVDMSRLADGTYIVNVTSGNAVKTIKVVKKQ